MKKQFNKTAAVLAGIILGVATLTGCPNPLGPEKPNPIEIDNDADNEDSNNPDNPDNPDTDDDPVVTPSPTIFKLATSFNDAAADLIPKYIETVYYKNFHQINNLLYYNIEQFEAGGTYYIEDEVPAGSLLYINGHDSEPKEIHIISKNIPIEISNVHADTTVHVEVPRVAGVTPKSPLRPIYPFYGYWKVEPSAGSNGVLSDVVLAASVWNSDDPSKAANVEITGTKGIWVKKSPIPYKLN